MQVPGVGALAKKRLPLAGRPGQRLAAEQGGNCTGLVFGETQTVRFIAVEAQSEA